MFKLLSKESNIFSIPLYIFFLLVVITTLNVLHFTPLGAISAAIAFVGVSLAYFLFSAINLTYHTHLPLFLYTVLIVGMYSGEVDLGISVSLLTNSFLLLILTSTSEEFRFRSLVLVGFLIALNFIFLPSSYPMLLFVLLHIAFTSRSILSATLRLLFGMLLLFLTYFMGAYLLDYTSWNEAYLVWNVGEVQSDLGPLPALLPVALLTLYSVWDHFRHFNKKSPVSKYKYTFLLLYLISLLISIVLYMGHHYEYLLLLALPVSIILSRMLRYLPRYWMQELGLWLIVFSVLLYKSQQVSLSL